MSVTTARTPRTARSDRPVRHLRPLRAVLAIAALIAAAFLGGCTSHPSTGTVVGKSYNEAYTAYVLTCFAFDAKGTCTMWIPIPETSGPFWVLDVRNGDEEWSVLTDRDAYDHTYVGDSWSDA